MLVELRIQVSGASVGLGCVSADFVGYVTKEINVDPSSDVQTVSLYVETPVAAGHLVLRNVDAAAHQAQVVIHEFGCFTAARNPLC
jgi:lipid-binding SYLF domain-containing protein